MQEKPPLRRPVEIVGYLLKTQRTRLGIACGNSTTTTATLSILIFAGELIGDGSLF